MNEELIKFLTEKYTGYVNPASNDIYMAISALESADKRIAELDAQIKDDRIFFIATATRHNEKIEWLESQLSECHKDAKRYRWITSNIDIAQEIFLYDYDDITREIDELIEESEK